MVERRSCCSGSSYLDVERRSCCSDSIDLVWRGGCVAQVLPIWRGEEVMLLRLYLVGVERRSCCSGSNGFDVERRSCCSRSICLSTPGSCLSSSWIHASHIYSHYMYSFLSWIVYVVFSLCCYSVHTTSIAHLSILEGGSLLCRYSWSFFHFFSLLKGFFCG